MLVGFPQRVVLCRGREIDQGDLLLTKLSTAGDSEQGELVSGEEFLPSSLAEIECGIDDAPEPLLDGEDLGSGWILWNARSNFDIAALPTDQDVS